MVKFKQNKKFSSELELQRGSAIKTTIWDYQKKFL